MYKIMDSIENVYPLLSQASARWTTRALISNVLENAAGHKRRLRSSKERDEGAENSGENVSMDESTPKRQSRPKRRKKMMLRRDAARKGSALCLLSLTSRYLYSITYLLAFDLDLLSKANQTRIRALYFSAPTLSTSQVLSILALAVFG